MDRIASMPLGLIAGAKAKIVTQTRVACRLPAVLRALILCCSVLVPGVGAQICVELADWASLPGQSFVGLSANGQKLLIGDFSGGFFIYDLDLQQVVGSSDGSQRLFNNVFSADGSVVAGYLTNADGERRAFRWAAGQLNELGVLPDTAGTYQGKKEGYAFGISADGSTVVGRSTSRINFGNQALSEAVRWGPDGAIESLGIGLATAVSADGSVAVGSFRVYADPDSSARAFRWSATTGYTRTEALDELCGFPVNLIPTFVSDDGQVVMGPLDCGQRNEFDEPIRGVFRWTASGGAEALWPPAPYVSMSIGRPGIDGFSSPRADGTALIGRLEASSQGEDAEALLGQQYDLLDSLLADGELTAAEIAGLPALNRYDYGYYWSTSTGFIPLIDYLLETYGIQFNDLPLGLGDWIGGQFFLSGDGQTVFFAGKLAAYGDYGSGFGFYRIPGLHCAETGSCQAPALTMLPAGAAFKTAQASSFVLETPTQAERLTVGQSYEIAWCGTGLDSVQVEFSEGTGGMLAFRRLAGVSGTDQRYQWTVPNVSSKRCRIRLTGWAGGQAVRDTSEPFTVKGYQLVRADADTFIHFSPTRHGWRFPNTAPVMWPPAYYQQFDYLGADPFTQRPYPGGFPNLIPLSLPDAIQAEADDYVSWPDFVKAFGVDQAYWSFLDQLDYRPLALLKWTTLISMSDVFDLPLVGSNGFVGACFGFATSAYQAFAYRDQFIAQYPEVGLQSDLYNIRAVTNARRSVIFQQFISQFGTAPLFYRLRNAFKSPNETLAQLKAMLLDEDAALQTLALTPPGHAVNAYKVVVDAEDPAIEWIYIYDNNVPGDTTRRIKVDTRQNEWSYGTLFTWQDRNNGLILEYPVQNLLAPTALAKKAGGGGGPGLADYIQVYNRPEVAMRITDASERSVGASGGQVFNEFDHSVLPIIPYTGYQHPPLGYLLPMGDYRFETTEFADGQTHVTVFAEAAAYSFSREDAQPGQTDHFAWRAGQGLEVSNRDAEAKGWNLQFIDVAAGGEQVVAIALEGLGADESVAVAWSADQRLQIVHRGAAKTYDLRLRGVGRDGHQVTIARSGLPLAADAVQQLAPTWEGLTEQGLLIYSDADRDGIFEDTLVVRVDTHVEERVAESQPGAFDLAQNYPNPFNSSTTIAFELAAAGAVDLAVFNLAGQRVETLIDGFRGSGAYAVTWDGRDALEQPLASGVYLYRLQAGDQVKMRKLVLVR